MRFTKNVNNIPVSNAQKQYFFFAEIFYIQIRMVTVGFFFGACGIFIAV